MGGFLVSSRHVQGSTYTDEPLRAWDLIESSLPGDVLADYAKLAAGRRINTAGVLLPLTPDELGELYRSLRARAPELFQ